MAKKKHRKLLRKTRHQRRNKKWSRRLTASAAGRSIGAPDIEKGLVSPGWLRGLLA